MHSLSFYEKLPLNEVEYLSFYEHELVRRKELGYPPALRLAELELKHSKEEIVEYKANLIAAQLMKFESVCVLGPAKPPVARIKKICSRKIYLKAHSFVALQQAYKSALNVKIKSSLFFTPDPLN